LKGAGTRRCKVTFSKSFSHLSNSLHRIRKARGRDESEKWEKFGNKNPSGGEILGLRGRVPVEEKRKTGCKQIEGRVLKGARWCDGGVATKGTARYLGKRRIEFFRLIGKRSERSEH